jgi:chromosome segregation protein
MIIKKLELQGFKSFPERTKIVFNPGITIIIGPNGTGKSNIVEAVQWVLGGQRVRSVRGEKIEDAIFSGTVKRPALGMADVTLVLENANEEIQINHRAFRTGESEYRLNGKAVRLRDIQDALWKRSISENKYFVIEQGAIGTFVTSKPTEKRALIEEAAGTAYYKDKKRQAENKLEDSERNLIRLEDIIAEVAKAKNSLARQAGAAERYRKLRERIRELTALHFRQRSHQLNAGQREIQDHVERSLADDREIGARLAAEERNLNAKRKEAWELEQSLKLEQEDLFSLKSRIARLEAEAERESKHLEFLAESRERAASSADELLSDLLSLEKEIGKSQKELLALKKDLAAKESEAGDREAAHKNSEAQLAPLAKKAEEARAEYLEKLIELTAAKNEGVKIEKELEILRRQEEKLKLKQDETREELARRERDIAATEVTVASLRRELSDAEQALARLESNRNVTLAAIEEFRADIQSRKEKRDKDVYHLQALRKLEEKERGAEPLSEVPTALGYFTELVESDPSDAPLIDVFWKEEARAAVVTAEDLLAVLGKREIRGNFLLAKEGSGQNVPQDLLEDPVVVGSLKARLRPGPKLKGRLPSLEDAVIVQDISAAIRLWLRFPEQNFVSLRGDALYSKGLLKLEHPKEGLFALSREIQDLENKIASQNEELAPLSRELEVRLGERADLGAKIEVATETLARAKSGLQEAENSLAISSAEKESLLDDLTLLSRELEVIELDKEGLAKRCEANNEVIRSLEDREQALRRQAEAEGNEHTLHREKIAEEARSLLELRGSINVLQEKIAGLEASLKSLGQRREAAAAKINASEESIRTSGNEESGLEARIGELRDQSRGFEEQRAARESQLAESATRLKQIQEELDVAEPGLASLREEAGRKKDERMTWEIRKAEIDRDLVNLEETCWQELKKTLQEIRAERETEPPAAGVQDVEAELEDAKEKLQKIGAVNFMAEEEYVGQKERYDFLTRERDDLRESIAQTKEAILKIDEESRERFKNAMAEVNKNFQDVFVMLFKGGSAEVRLTDDGSPLESGVEVIAQPPGKKIQNMSLLSGGEKSLTSLAFLFALFRYKPTPFCILDEVDAALDEVNLERFLDLMKRIKNETQFIIITHNYKTMEVADYIYGTTMEEPNVTKLFSMKLEKKEAAEKID